MTPGTPTSGHITALWDQTEGSSTSLSVDDRSPAAALSTEGSLFQQIKTVLAVVGLLSIVWQVLKAAR